MEIIRTLQYLRQRAIQVRSEQGYDSDEYRQIEACMLDLTGGMEEHPEDWDWPCMCQLCCSYGDPEE